MTARACAVSSWRAFLRHLLNQTMPSMCADTRHLNLTRLNWTLIAPSAVQGQECAQPVAKIANLWQRDHHKVEGQRPAIVLISPMSATSRRTPPPPVVLACSTAPPLHHSPVIIGGVSPCVGSACQIGSAPGQLLPKRPHRRTVPHTHDYRSDWRKVRSDLHMRACGGL